MTLNITAISPNRIVQVSDRRIVALPNYSVLHDEANKAVVISCRDALLSITYAGIAAIGPQQTDRWLARTLLDAAAPELSAQQLVSSLAAAAARWLGRLTSVGPRLVFVVAGFERANARPQYWVISNSRAGDLAHEGGDTFEVSRGRHTPRLLVTGLAKAFERSDRRRLQAVGRSARTPHELEPAIVAAIRDAASRPKWSWGIGSSCMSILLTPAGQIRATYYPFGETPRSYGPHFLFYAGGYNVLIESPDAMLGSGYGIVFGAEPTTLMLVGQGPQISLPSGRPKVELERVEAGAPLNPNLPLPGQVRFRVQSVPATLEVRRSRELNLVRVVRLSR